MRPETFIKSFIGTLTNPKYYVDVLNVRMWFSVRFLLLSYLVLSLLATVIFTLIDIPKLRQSLSTFITESAQQFPQQGSISWNGLSVEMSGMDKYSLPFPNLPDAVGTPPTLLEVNPSVTDVNQISQSGDERSLVVIGEKTAYLAQPGGGWTDFPLTDLLSSDEFTISKESVTREAPSYQERLQTTLRALPFLFLAFFFFISFPLRLLTVVIDSLLIYFMIKISGLPLTLKKVIQLSMHIMVAAELITILTANFSSDLQMFSLAFWGYTFIIYWNLRHIKALSPIEAERLNKE